MAEKTQQELLEEQKKNCIFCRIIAGEIPSKKVYEDEKFLAILDINPVVPGHVLLMPKEHIPILAITPEQLQRDLFSLAAKLSSAISDAMIAQKLTIVCQSGYAAGQKPPFHVMLHLLPREKGDALEKFDLAKQDVNQADALALVPVFEQTTKQVLAHVGREDLLTQHHIHKKHDVAESTVPVQESKPVAPVHEPVSAPTPLVAPAPPVAPAPEDAVLKNTAKAISSDEQVVEFDSPSEALEHVLAVSPDLRRFIIMQPELVEDYIKKSPKLQKLFEGININALSAALKYQDAQQQRRDAANAQAADVEGVDSESESESGSNDGSSRAGSSGSDEVTARDMSESALFSFIDSNEGLRMWLLEHPKELADNINKNPKLQRFFSGVDVVELAKRYRGYVMRGGRK
jgi:histidine triad (HIT) family protein